MCVEMFIRIKRMFKEVVRTMYRIMIVEDDKTIASILKEFLTSWNFEVSLVKDFHHVIDKFKIVEPELVLLDISLPCMNGYYWCEKIRNSSKVPIIFISSAHDNMNIVMAMSAGADDFVIKPFDLNVLLAKIQAMLRRTYEFSASLEILEYQGIRFNIGSCSITYQNQRLELTKNESKILKLLIEHRTNITTRDELMDYLWQTDSYIDENTLSVNVNRLRKKLESIGIYDFIHTKKGIGYYLR